MDRTDGIGNCSITVHLKQTKQVPGRGVLFEACRVGSVNESDGSMTLYWNLGELTNLRPSVPTERVTAMLSEMLYGRKASGEKRQEGADQDVERRKAVTEENGTCTFTHLEAGAWLIHTGRELVKLYVTITLEEEQIPRLTGEMWLNGVGVQFGAVCPYRDLKRMKTMPNIAAVMPRSGCDDPACQLLGAENETACDDGVIVPFTGDQARVPGRAQGMLHPTRTNRLAIRFGQHPRIIWR